MESDERREIIKIYWQQYLLLEKANDRTVRLCCH